MEVLTGDQKQFGCNLNDLIVRSPLELLFCIIYFIACIIVAGCGLHLYNKKKNGNHEQDERIGHNDNKQNLV